MSVPDPVPKARAKFVAPSIKLQQKAGPPCRSFEPPSPVTGFTEDGKAFVVHIGQGPSGPILMRISGDGVDVTESAPQSLLSTLTLDREIRLENLIVKKVLGHGASGQVKLMEDRRTKVKYAVKKISDAPISKIQRIFKSEVLSLFEKSNFLVDTVQAYIKDRYQLILVQEYMNWGSLGDLLCLCTAKSIRIPEEVISVITRQMLQGLCHLHNREAANTTRDGKSQMHRDIKPGNILLNSQGECKLADFGIAREVATGGVSSFIGTPTYMSPERIRGERYSIPADIWAVGLTVAEMGLGRYPFKVGDNFITLLEEITSATTISLPESSDELADYVHALIKQDPEQRPQASDALQLPFIKKYESSDLSVVTTWHDTYVRPHLPSPPPDATAQT